MSVYEPCEDSDLLEKEVRKLAKGLVLDVGTGSGVQAIAAGESEKVDSVIAVDINEEALELASRNAKRKNISEGKIKFFISDLFSLFDYYNIDASGNLIDLKDRSACLNAENSGLNKKFKAKGPVTKSSMNIRSTAKNIADKGKKGIKKMQFDTILFNPPYLPQENNNRDISIEGGKKGYEIIQKFLERLAEFLKDEGICLLVFSSHTKRDVVDNIITQQLFEFEQIAIEKMFFEELYVYKIKKTDELKQIIDAGFTNIKYFAHGKRGIIHTALYKAKAKQGSSPSVEKKVAIKTKKKESEAIGRIENEAAWLKKLNKKGIGPNLIMSNNTFLAYEFVEGKFFPDYIATATKKDVTQLIHDLLKQCNEMDMMFVDKEEMHHPLKHIIVSHEDGKPKAVMLDFERMSNTEKPKNVTQFCVYLVGDFVLSVLKSKGIEVDREQVLEAAKEYKHNMDKEHFEKILKLF
ncbi:MAG: methyltransferase [Nanoarchaeota archaeon]|nr:methyltransferase [Nanoarchaeota archaeon]